MKKLFLLLAFFCLSVQAQTYKVYSQFPAGSTPDILVRKLFDTVEQKTNYKFIHLNRPGADGVVAYKSFLQESSSKILSTTTSLIADNLLDVREQTKSLLFYYKLDFFLITLKESKLNNFNDINGKLNVGSIGKNQDLMFKAMINDKEVQIIRYNSDVEIINAILRKDIEIGNISNVSIPYRANRNAFKIIGDFNKLNFTLGGSLVVEKNMLNSELLNLNKVLNEAIQDREFRNWFVVQFERNPVGGNPEVLDKIVKEVRDFQEK